VMKSSARRAARGQDGHGRRGFGTAAHVRTYFKDKKEADRPLEQSVLAIAKGTTPLMLASYHGNLDAVRYLLELGPM